MIYPTTPIYAGTPYKGQSSEDSVKVSINKSDNKSSSPQDIVDLSREAIAFLKTNSVNQ